MRMMVPDYYLMIIGAFAETQKWVKGGRLKKF
jgi:hypothetical protein